MIEEMEFLDPHLYSEVIVPDPRLFSEVIVPDLESNTTEYDPAVLLSEVD